HRLTRHLKAALGKVERAAEVGILWHRRILEYFQCLACSSVHQRQGHRTAVQQGTDAVLAYTGSDWIEQFVALPGKSRMRHVGEQLQRQFRIERVDGCPCLAADSGIAEPV